MKKTNILVVFDYGDTPDSKYVQELNNVLNKNKYNIISEYYAQYSPKEAKTDIENISREKKIDIYVGIGLGGYILTLLDNDFKKILIDPIFDPETELKDIPAHVIDFYKKDKIEMKNKNIITMFIDKIPNGYKDITDVANIHEEDIYKTIKNIIEKS